MDRGPPSDAPSLLLAPPTLGGRGLFLMYCPRPLAFPFRSCDLTSSFSLEREKTVVDFEAVMLLLLPLPNIVRGEGSLGVESRGVKFLGGESCGVESLGVKSVEEGREFLPPRVVSSFFWLLVGGDFVFFDLSSPVFDLSTFFGPHWTEDEEDEEAGFSPEGWDIVPGKDGQVSFDLRREQGGEASLCMERRPLDKTPAILELISVDTLKIVLNIEVSSFQGCCNIELGP